MTIPNCVKSNTFLSLDGENNYTVNDLTIENDDLFTYNEDSYHDLVEQIIQIFDCQIKEMYPQVLSI